MRSGDCLLRGEVNQRRLDISQLCGSVEARAAAVPEAGGTHSEGETAIPPTLVSSETLTTGVLNLVYSPAESTSATYEGAKVHLPQTAQ